MGQWAVIGQHGSWNRETARRVQGDLVPFTNGMPPASRRTC